MCTVPNCTDFTETHLWLSFPYICVKYMETKQILHSIRMHSEKTMKGQLGLGDLSTIGIIFVVLAVVLAVGAYILLSIGNTGLFPSNSVANTTLQQGQTALKTFATWLPILAVVVVAGVVIYILINMFHGAGSSRGAV